MPLLLTAGAAQQGATVSAGKQIPACAICPKMSDMTEIPAWFDRKFEFTFPPERYPNLCIRLRGTPAYLEELVRNVTRDVMTHKPDGMWSAQEHVGHLLDLDPLWFARANDFLREGETLTPADLSNRKTHEANHNDRFLGEILEDFRRERMALLELLGKQQPECFSRTLIHPRLKQPMRLVDHLFFAAEHDDHHMAKIWELIRGK